MVKIDWKNPKEVKEYNKKYYETNKDKIKVKNREYRENPLNKARKKKIAREYNKMPKVKFRRKELRARPEERAKRKEYDKSIKRKKYSAARYKLPEVKRYHDDYNNNPKTKKRKKLFYKRTKKATCIICGKKALTKYCSRKCFAVGNTGENNYKWTGGSKLYPKIWNEKFRRAVRDRDNNICMRCRKPREILNRALAVHHIDGVTWNTCFENSISLCTSCHAIVEGSGKKIEIFQPLFQKMLSKLYGYEYETN